MTWLIIFCCLLFSGYAVYCREVNGWLKVILVLTALAFLLVRSKRWFEERFSGVEVCLLFLVSVASVGGGIVCLVLAPYPVERKNGGFFEVSRGVIVRSVSEREYEFKNNVGNIPVYSAVAGAVAVSAIVVSRRK